MIIIFIISDSYHIFTTTNNDVKTMATFKEIWKIQTVDQKSDFISDLQKKFPNIASVTALNWARTICPTTPNADVCIWVANYFKAKPSTVFPEYARKVATVERRNKKRVSQLQS